MLRVTALVGRASDPALAARLHEIEHLGGLETVRMTQADMSRRRQQLRTEQGTELALMLDRDAVLEQGSVLLLEPTRAVVIALDRPRWLVLRAPDAARALELGYFAGNMHWKVRFDGAALCIALEGPRADYLQRLSHLLASGEVVVEAEAPNEGSGHDDGAGHSHDHDHDHDHGHDQEHEHAHDPAHGHGHAHDADSHAPAHAHADGHRHHEV